MIFLFAVLSLLERFYLFSATFPYGGGLSALKTLFLGDLEGVRLGLG